MKILPRMFFIILPFAAYLVLGQTTFPKQSITAVIFATAALVAIFRPGALFLSPSLSSAFRRGMMLFAVFVFLMAFMPLGGLISGPLMLEHSKEPAQAIFVLASGATMAGEPGYSGLQRVMHGVKLLKSGQAPHLFLSTGYSKINGHAEAAWVASYVALLNIDPASITVLISPEIVTTATEAQYARKALGEKGIDDILLVTSGSHIYRSYLTFKKAGFSVKPAPVHNKFSILYANENFTGSFYAAAREWFGLLYYKLMNRI